MLAYAILALLRKAGKSATPRALGVPYLPENPTHLVNPCKYIYHLWYYLLDIMIALLCSSLKFSADRQSNVAQTHQPDLILLGMMLSNLSANQVIDDLKHDSKTATIPIIAVTPLTMTQDDDSRCRVWY